MISYSSIAQVPGEASKEKNHCRTFFEERMLTRGFLRSAAVVRSGRSLVRPMTAHMSTNSSEEYYIPGSKPIYMADTVKKTDSADVKPLYYIQDEEKPINYDEVPFDRCKLLNSFSGCLIRCGVVV
jgi:hypothetical protein